MGVRVPGRLNTCLIILTTQISEVRLSFPFMKRGRTGVGGKKRTLALLVPAGPI